MDFLRSLPCWLWPLISGLLCGVLGYYLGRTTGENDDNDFKTELDTCKRKTASLQTDLDACHKKTSSLQADLDACNLQLKATPVTTSATASIASSFAAGAATTAATTQASGISGVPFDGIAAKAAFGKKKVIENDLTIVEGIGPKISELFHNHDIRTWAALANTSVDRCQEVLNSGGKRYEIHRPGTWPMQAEMAALGQWSQLKKWQDEHDYGKA